MKQDIVIIEVNIVGHLKRNLKERKRVKQKKGTEESQERNSKSCRKENRSTKRKLERTDTDKRKKQRTEHEKSNRNWKSGERFQGIDSVTGEYVSGKILSKVKGNNENLYNIQSDQNGYQRWFDMNEVKDIEVIGDATEIIVLYNNDQVVEVK